MIHLFGARSRLVLAALLAAGCAPERTEKPPESLTVYAVKAEVSSEATQLVLTGEVRPRSEAVIGFRVGGKLIDRPAEVGAAVKRGDILARLDARDLSLQTQATGAQRTVVQTDLAQQVADLERYQSLLKQGFISQAEYDRRKSAVEVAKARVAEVSTVQSGARNQLDYAVIRADEAGVVTGVDAERGQVLAPGQPVLRIARAGSKEVLVAVAEGRLQALQTARELTITVAAVPGKSYRGRLREVAPAADPATRTYPARITVEDADDDLRFGMTARVVARGDAQTALMVPTTALYRNGDKTAVWTVEPGTSITRLVNVTPGSVRDDKVAIVQGLNGGEMIVIAGVQKLKAGQVVRVIAP